MTSSASQPHPQARPGDLLRQLAALASPHRLRVLAALVDAPTHVSQLARIVEISRPLLQMHLQKLEGAGLVRSRLELGIEGRAMRIYEIAFTEVLVTPAIVRAVAAALPPAAPPDAPTD